MVVTATIVYLGHAIDFHVSFATSSLLQAKSETKRYRNRVEKFFRNSAYILQQHRICVRITTLTCSIGCLKVSCDSQKGNETFRSHSHLHLPISSSQIRNKLLRGVVGSRQFFLSARREGAFTIRRWLSSTIIPLPPKN